MSERDGPEPTLQNYGSAQEVLGDSITTAASTSLVTYNQADDGAPYEVEPLEAFQRAVRQQRAALFLGRAIEVRKVPLFAAPLRRSVRAPHKIKHNPVARVALIVFALVITAAAIWASWEMLAASLPLDPVLLFRKVSEKLASRPR